MFLCGPAIRHGEQTFPFIHKFRQRFAVVAKKIADNLDLEAEILDEYHYMCMYMHDLEDYDESGEDDDEEEKKVRVI